MNNKTPLTDLDIAVQKTVAVDLDGCLAYYDGWKGPDHIGSPIPNMVMICHWLHDQGVNIVVNTCRLNKTNNCVYGVDTKDVLATIRTWLNDNDLPFVGISLDDGKPFAQAYIDDRAVSFREDKTIRSICSSIMRLLE